VTPAIASTDPTSTSPWFTSPPAQVLVGDVPFQAVDRDAPDPLLLLGRRVGF
jgi:hypothetical protein